MAFIAENGGFALVTPRARGKYAVCNGAAPIGRTAKEAFRDEVVLGSVAPPLNRWPRVGPGGPVEDAVADCTTLAHICPKQLTPELSRAAKRRRLERIVRLFLLWFSQSRFCILSSWIETRILRPMRHYPFHWCRRQLGQFGGCKGLSVGLWSCRKSHMR